MARPPSKRTLQRRAQREREHAGEVYVAFWTNGDRLTDKLVRFRVLDRNVSDIPDRRNAAAKKLIEAIEPDE